jgi:hypothetical protein
VRGLVINLDPSLTDVTLRPQDARAVHACSSGDARDEVNVERGTVHITHFGDRVRLAGSYQLVFPGAVTVAGSFDAAFCP